MIFFLFFAVDVFSLVASSSEDCESIRRENELLRELVALYRGSPEIKPSKPTTGNGGPPTWSTSYITSTYTTLVTVPVSTEVPLTLNGQHITTTIVDYETKETVSTSLIPTSTLVYPTINSDPVSKTDNKDIAPTSSKSLQDIKPTSSKQLDQIEKKDDVKQNSKYRGRLAGLKKKAAKSSESTKSSYQQQRKKSFSISRSRFPGFNSNKFSGRFKRQAIADPRLTPESTQIQLEPSF